MPVPAPDSITVKETRGRALKALAALDPEDQSQRLLDFTKSVALCPADRAKQALARHGPDTAADSDAVALDALAWGNLGR